ncbi:GNAT family N-acetyltransferase [Nocardia terpenica]|uniref:GNAT family N-acetyltransferase n=1 Tax=Nocardia terpenica TaxID=455432 RepID=UPI001884AFE4|nr:GNAT family N-acetyltransferase [Nocardia terpenica]
MTIHGLWTRLEESRGADPSRMLARVFESSAQRLFAGSAVAPVDDRGLGALADASDRMLGYIYRRDDRAGGADAPRPIGIYDCRLAEPARMHVGVVLAGDAAWGDGVGMDAMLALLRYLFHFDGRRAFEMTAAVHNPHTVRIMVHRAVRPEALLADVVADGSRLVELAVGTLTEPEFAEVGYRVPGGSAFTDTRWHEVRERVLAQIGAQS